MNPLIVHVVIPARNEQQLVGQAVAAVKTACAVAEAEGAVQTTCTVVADDCTDDTARIAAAAGAQVFTVRAHNVGAARRVGITVARQLTPRSSADTWIACTDADSVVPPNWLTAHLGQRRAGAHMVLGPVQPRAEDLPLALLNAWHANHQPGRTPSSMNIHGANMSFAATAYDVAGGFAPLAVHEDRELVNSFRRHRLEVHCVTTAQVLTSGRRVGRAPAGFSTYLRALADGTHAEETAPMVTEE